MRRSTDLPLTDRASHAQPPQAAKKLLVIADPVEWYGASNYHHQAASHAMAVVERLGRESGAFVSTIRTDMHLLTKGPAGEGARGPSPLRL